MSDMISEARVQRVYREAYFVCGHYLAADEPQCKKCLSHVRAVIAASDATLEVTDEMVEAARAKAKELFCVPIGGKLHSGVFADEIIKAAFATMKEGEA